MAKTFNITHPDGSINQNLSPASYTLDESGSDAAILSLTIEHDFARFDDESAATNPVQVGAYIVYTRGSQVRFRGKVYDINRNEASPNYITLIAYDKSKGLRSGGTLASISGVYRWSVETAIVDFANVALSADCQTDGYDPDSPYPVYPAYSEMTDTPDSTSPWIAKNASRTTTLAQDIVGVAAATPIQITDVTQFKFPGFFQINTEIIQVEHGYIDASGDHWLGGSMLRGALGSTPATHSTSDNIYQRVPKVITDARDYEVRRDPSDKIITAAEYRVKHTDGRFDFPNDPSAYTTLEADYSAYDMDDAAAETVGTVIGYLMEATVANLGPGYAGADYDTSGLDTMYVTRIYPDNPLYTWDAISWLLDESWAAGGVDTDRHLGYYSSADNKYYFKSIKQDNASPDYTIRGGIEHTDTASLSALYSAALVQFFTDEPSSLLATDRVYHPTVGDQTDHCGGGGNANLFNAILYQDVERAGGAGWQADTATGSNNIYTSRLFDGDPSSGWGIRAADTMWDTADPWTWILFTWFPSAQILDYVKMSIDIRSWVPSFYAIEVVGLDSYTPGDPPSLGNVVPLSRTLFWTVPNTSTPSLMRPRSMVLNTRSNS